MTTPFLIPDLEHDEGVRLLAYRDSKGIWTIGVGHNIQADPNLLPILDRLKTQGITQAQCDGLLQTDTTNVDVQLDKALPWWRHMTDPRQDVLANMCFNMGLGTLMEFKNTLAAMEEGNYGAAADGMLDSKWATQVGKGPGQRAYRLSEQMRSGVRLPQSWDVAPVT